MGDLRGVKSLWHAPAWAVCWSNATAFMWESRLGVFSPLTVINVRVTAGIVCSTGITHRPLEILGSQQHRGTGCRKSVTPSLRLAGRVLMQRSLHVLSQFEWLAPAKAQACQHQSDGWYPGTGFSEGSHYVPLTCWTSV